MLTMFNSRGEQERSDVAELISLSNYRVEFDSYALSNWAPSKTTQACLWALGVAEYSTIEDIVSSGDELDMKVYEIFGAPASMTFGCDMDTFSFFANSDDGMPNDTRLIHGVNVVDCTNQLPRLYREFINKVLNVAGAGVDSLMIEPAPWYKDQDNVQAVSVSFNGSDEQLWKRLRATWSREWLLSKTQYGVAGRPIYSAVPAGVNGDTDVDAIIQKIEDYGRRQSEKQNIDVLCCAYQDLQWLWWTRDKFRVVPTVIISE